MHPARGFRYHAIIISITVGETPKSCTPPVASCVQAQVKTFRRAYIINTTTRVVKKNIYYNTTAFVFFGVWWAFKYNNTIHQKQGLRNERRACVRPLPARNTAAERTHVRIHKHRTTNPYDHGRRTGRGVRVHIRHGHAHLNRITSTKGQAIPRRHDHKNPGTGGRSTATTDGPVQGRRF